MDSFILLLDARGAIRAATPGARELIGDCEGRPCWRLVAATDGRRAICVPECARGARAVAEDRYVHIRGRQGRLICQRLGGEIAVIFLPGRPPPRPGRSLTPRERAVLDLVARGMTDREIGRELGIRHATVRTHIEHIRDKLCASTRAQAVALGIATGELPCAR